MKKFLSLCIATVLLCVGCSDNNKKETESDSDIEASVVTNHSEDIRGINSEAETTAVETITSKNTVPTTVKIQTTEICDEKEFIITEKNEEKIDTPVSTKPNVKQNQTVTSTAVSSSFTTKTPAKTHTTTVVNTTVRILTTTVTQMPEKQPETTAKTEVPTKSDVIELPFVPIR